MRRRLSFDAYRGLFADFRSFRRHFGFSVLMALVTIIFGMLIVVPTAYLGAPEACPRPALSSNSSRSCRSSYRRSSSSSAISGSTTRRAGCR
jgi:hypothetical protein